ncbi:hypothetical protein [Sphingosinicella sp.]|uniref:hypothetical protein n=1 Tax=Sphingosinicella sp. TaxID=1917971 RepID=UPI0017E7E8FB|nr:hypothetical protein [Sphingosinicella sp.]MBA4758409.1 hypothetical protein [Sphingosinicella sp.]
MIKRLWKALSKKPVVYRFWSTRQLWVFRADNRDRDNLKWTEPFEVNSIDALERFEPIERWHDRDTFLADAKSRIARGGVAVTLVRDGKLVSWSFGIPTTESYMPYVDQKIIFPTNAASIYSGYVAPSERGKGIHRQQQNRRVAALLDKCEAIFSFAEGANKAAIKAAMGSAMHHVATLETRWRFYKPHKRVIVIDPALDMRFEAPLYTSDGAQLQAKLDARASQGALLEPQ